MARTRSWAGVAALLAACGAAGPAAADPIADFYRDKTITVVIGYPAGGGFDAYGRLVADHLPRFLPGTPKAIVQYMPGASSLKAVSNIYNVAAQDGSVIGMAGIQIVFDAFVRGEVGDKVDVTKINWIGRLAMMDSVAIIRQETGVRGLQDLRTRKVFFGGTSAAAGSGYLPVAVNKLFGTQIEVTLGYAGTTEQYLAIERGEIDGVTNAIWSQLQRSRPDWIRDKKIVPIFQDSAERYPFLPDVPTIMELAESEEQRKLLRLMAVPSTFGRSFYAGPKVPPQRVAALRTAFMAMTEDAAVKAQVRDLNLDVWPMSGEGLQTIVADIGRYPKELFEQTLQLISPVPR